MLTIVLHPDVPTNVRSSSSVEMARIISTLGFSTGVIALLVSVGLSGWVRSRQSGIATSTVSLIGLALVFWAMRDSGDQPS